MSLRFSAPLLATATLLSCLGASQASAQTAAAPAAVPNGPAIPGVCVFDRDGLLARSSVGKATATRLQQLSQQASAELNTEGTALQNEYKTLQAAKPAANDPRAAAFAQKYQAFEQKSALRNRELQMTQQKAFARVLTEAQPLITQIYTQQKCSILLDRSAVFLMNAQMDITPATI
ncbi:MAG: OmpH family outer membrane protein, partial [Caulobacteraceae bacterium]